MRAHGHDFVVMFIITTFISIPIHHYHPPHPQWSLIDMDVHLRKFHDEQRRQERTQV